MRHRHKTTRALSTVLTLVGALAASAALAQSPPATSPSAPANGPGPATQPAPPPATTQPAPTQPAPVTPAAPAATPPPNYNLQYTGLFDGYYLFQFSNPRFNQAPYTTNNLGFPRSYDVRHNSPALNLAEINIFQNPRPNNFGFKATLIAGDVPDSLGTAGTPGTSLANNGLGETRFKNLRQLYGTYAFGSDGSGIDFGTFYSPYSYETTEASGDYNYSRSIPFFFTPVYEAGARIYAVNALGAKGLTATAWLVNAVFNTSTAGIQDDNKQPAYMGQLLYADPKGKFTVTSEIGLDKDKLNGSIGSPYFATDGSGNPIANVNTRVTMNDNNFTYNFDANHIAGLDLQYIQLKPNGGPKITNTGYAVYYRQQLNPKDAVALRVSGVDIKTDSYSNVAENFGTTHVHPYEFTATYEVKAAANFTTRFEYRHDHSNDTTLAGLFGGSTPNKKDQDSVVVGALFTF